MLLSEAGAQFDLELNHIDFVEGENTLSKLHGLQFPHTQTIYENFLILSRKKDLVVCIDPDDQAIPVISMSNLESTTIVTHMNDNYLKKNLIQSMARGESITVRNADRDCQDGSVTTISLHGAVAGSVAPRAHTAFRACNLRLTSNFTLFSST